MVIQSLSAESVDRKRRGYEAIPRDARKAAAGRGLADADFSVGPGRVQSLCSHVCEAKCKSLLVLPHLQFQKARDVKANALGIQFQQWIAKFGKVSNMIVEKQKVSIQYHKESM